ncbi:MAG: TIGR03905 family TSCPD domain-containing protein [Acutalibacteraceae bacterium]|nr:TIGR03905 family TSCPD domain-containing protein [Acutalibacteraceae bacterium]
MRYSYQTHGTCSQQIDFDLDGDVVSNIEFYGGCNGNLKGICSLCDGMTVDEIEDHLKGIQCGFKPTSCPDQLATAVRAAYEQSENK